MRFRAELRARWFGMLGVALLVGIAGGAVLASAAGARRTASTVDRVARSQRASDLLINPNSSDGGASFAKAFDAIDTLPQVKTITTINGVLSARLLTNGQPDVKSVINVVALAAADDREWRTIDRPFIVDGRLPDPRRADEVLINSAMARRQHFLVGSRMRLGIWAQQDIKDFSHFPKPRLISDFTVVGIGKMLDEATRAPDDPNLNPTLGFTPALNDRIKSFTPPYVGKTATLKNGARDVPAFEADVRDLFRNVFVKGSNGPEHVNMNFQETALTIARARRAIRPYVLALWLFAALAALAALAVIGQAIGRSMRPLREEAGTLGAIGFTHRELLELAAMRGAVIGAIGAATAFVIAVATSPAMPLGPLRGIDPARAVDVDGVVLGAGVAVIVLFVVASALIAMRRRGRVRRSTTVAVGNRLAQAGAAISVVSGVRFALDRGRDRSVPLPSTLFGITIAVAALVATLVYGAGLTRFTSTPARYGWPWTYQVVLADDNMSPMTLAHRLAKIPYVESYALGGYSQFDVGGHSVAAIGVDRAPGLPFVPMLAGHAPSKDDEIVLGAKTMSTLGTHVGKTIHVNAQGHERDFHVVGTGVFPRLAPYPGSEPTGLGIGAATTAHALQTLRAPLGAPYLMVNLRNGSRVSAAQLKHDLGGDQHDFGYVFGAQRPNDVLSYDHLDRTPLMLAAVLVLLALGSAIHLLVTGVRGRRRDIAMLKTIGVTSGQARVAVLVQATVLVGLTLVVALPLGVLAGRWLWIATAHWLGIASDPALPLVALAAVTVGALVTANLIAFGPASIAARIRPAVALRSE
jgi:ABC-type antimicrobial peptide transport system permease subunit